MSSPPENRSIRSTVVGIVAPSGYEPDPLAGARADALLLAQGCEVRHFDVPDARYLRFADTDTARLAGLHAAACDPEVDVVLTLRGGYGMSRLLQAIDFDLLVKSGKLFAGFSDITALHLGLLAHGGMSFAGPTVVDFGTLDVSDFTMSQFWHVLHGPVHVVTARTSDIAPVDVRGTLWGGNLAMVAHMTGTPWMPAIEGGILFLEDINEHPYRIERMLLQLLHAGILDRQKAIVLGDFSGGRTSDYDNGYDFSAMLAFVRTRTDVPIVTGLPFGHIRDKTTLVVGADATLRVEAGQLQLSMHDYPHLR